MPLLYPLRFKPLFRRYLWGGRRLETSLGKTLGAGNDYAESWELVDRGSDQSVVAAGPLAGRTLAQLIDDAGPDLLGATSTQFPLLFKFLDAHDRLSVQVHPGDELAARLDPPEFGKTEAWVILEATPGSYLYAGLKRGFDRAAIERELSRGTCELCLERIEPRAGDCFFLPAGVIHALGPGLLVAELQQSSDTTYRLFDWNRRGPDGKPRALHIDQALEAIDFTAGPITAQTPLATSLPHVARLVTCDKFIIDRWQLNTPQAAGGDGRCHILVMLEGSGLVAGDMAERPLVRGEVIVLPAALGPVQLTPQAGAVLLDAYLP